MKQPQRSHEVEKWLRQEIKEQQARYRKIARAMNEEIAPQREEWIAGFLERIQTRGFNVHADIRRRIKPEELFPRPKRKLKVVF